MVIDTLIKKLELIKSSTDVNGDDNILIYINGEKFEIEAIELDSETSDILIEVGVAM